MKVAALAGGIGAGKFLRGLVRVVRPSDVTVIVNVGDDIRMHGLAVSPDIDSVTYWLAGVQDRERGWGRRGETFRATSELKELGAQDAWFGLGDTDLATHVFRTVALERGETLSKITTKIRGRFGVQTEILPVTDDPITTRIDAVDNSTGERLDLHFQEYWVQRGARDAVKGVRFEGAEDASPGPGVEEAIKEADAILICPSNPVVSIAPLLAVPGVRDLVRSRRPSVVGISPIVGGAPVAGMADRLMPSFGLEVTAYGAGAAVADICGGWVIDHQDASMAQRIRRDLGMEVAVTDTIMTDDAAAASLARTAIALLGL
jgi:LPPG:FO 2-phospho-L-lactate transferase